MGVTVLFGRYRLIEPAGRGGTAEVWRARDERSGDEVAVKRLHPLVFASRAGRERLLREFRALRDLRHPNVVRVRDLELTDDEGALVLDYIDGRSLRDRLADGPPLSMAAAITIAADVAAALAEAHGRGIVHRDVTPGNILLDGQQRALLTDFGIARGDNETTVMTATGTLVGTLRYLAPEQLRGEEATPAGDLYALAAVTYEMLAGRPAFEAVTPVALVDAQRAGPAPIEGAPPAVDAAVRRAMATDPAQRQPSVAAFVAELRAAADGAPAGPGVAPAASSATAAGGTPASAHDSVGHRPALPAIVALVFGALVVAALALGGGPPGPADDRSAASPVADPTTAPTPIPDPEGDAGGNGNGNRNGNGNGLGNGGGDDDDDRGGGNGNGNDNGRGGDD
jgi:hypothetical protein